jgi:O-antigen ligase
VLGKATVFDFVFLVLLLYSFVPYRLSVEVFLPRFGGVPISYIPFLVFFALLFVREFVRGFVAKSIKLGWGDVFFAMFLFAYLPLQLLLLRNIGYTLDVADYLLDYAMFCFYGTAVFFGTRLYFLNRSHDPLTLANRIVERMLKVFFLICIIAPIRYFLFDTSSAQFYTTYNPLQYRLFLPLFLVPCSLLTLGRFFATRQGRYLLYFAIYGGNLYLCQSRTGYVAFIFVLAYLLLKEKFGLFLRPQWFVTGIILAAGFYLGGEKALKRVRRLEELQMFATLDMDDAVKLDKDKRRITFLVASIEILKESPLIGVGLGKHNLEANFPTYFTQYVHSVARPHNFYLYMLVSTGIIGAVLIVLFLYNSVYKPQFFIIARDVSNKQDRELLRHLYLVQITILIMQLGYEFETTPFIWFIWGLSSAVFGIATARERVSWAQKT